MGFGWRSTRMGVGLVVGLGLWACDQNPREAEAIKAPDRGAAFDTKPEGCAATAEALAQQWVGQPLSAVESSLDVAALAEVRVLRIIRPGTMVTKDYRIDRLNVALDEQETVTKFYCG